MTDREWTLFSHRIRVGNRNLHPKSDAPFFEWVHFFILGWNIFFLWLRIMIWIHDNLTCVHIFLVEVYLSAYESVLHASVSFSFSCASPGHFTQITSARETVLISKKTLTGNYVVTTHSAQCSSSDFLSRVQSCMKAKLGRLWKNAPPISQ